MSNPRTEDKDTTIKDKAEPLQVTEDMEDVADELNRNTGATEEELIAPRPDSDKSPDFQQHNRP